MRAPPPLKSRPSAEPSETHGGGSTTLRSLSGRSARLADGLSRNPPDRDDLLKQRTKDLQGLIGQLRGFSLEEFLGEEGPGRVTRIRVQGAGLSLLLCRRGCLFLFCALCNANAKGGVCARLSCGNGAHEQDHGAYPVAQPSWVPGL